MLKKCKSLQWIKKMTTIKHFEELWNDCENFFTQSSGLDIPLDNLSEELSMKFRLYQTIDAKNELSQEERQQAKSRVLGEVILTLTLLSAKDNINVYEALATALQFRQMASFR